VGTDADIQNLGQSFAFDDLQSIPSNEWSPTHRVDAEVDNVYLG
jgi:hypothetical protein